MICGSRRRRLGTFLICRRSTSQLHDISSPHKTDPEAIIAALRSEVAEVDANIPSPARYACSEDRQGSLVRANVLAPDRFIRTTGACTGLRGLYGTMSYFVARRTNEIGIRMALGAQPVRVFRMVLGEGLILTGAGVVVGLAGAVFGARLISSALYQVPALTL